MWQGETQAVRNEFKVKADIAKHEHQEKYPGYSYKPRKSSEKKRRMTKKKAAALGLDINQLGAPNGANAVNEGAQIDPLQVAELNLAHMDGDAYPFEWADFGDNFPLVDYAGQAFFEGL